MAGQARAKRGGAQAAGKAERKRRPVGFWASFNDWWRSEQVRLRRRPVTHELVRWYTENGHLTWPDPEERPTWKETRIHAKCLRSIEDVKMYFRRYRLSKSKQEDRGSVMGDDDEGGDEEYEEDDGEVGEEEDEESPTRGPSGRGASGSGGGGDGFDQKPPAFLSTASARVPALLVPPLQQQQRRGGGGGGRTYSPAEGASFPPFAGGAPDRLHPWLPRIIKTEAEVDLEPQALTARYSEPFAPTATTGSPASNEDSYLQPDSRGTGGTGSGSPRVSPFAVMAAASTLPRQQQYSSQDYSHQFSQQYSLPSQQQQQQHIQQQYSQSQRRPTYELQHQSQMQFHAGLPQVYKQETAFEHAFEQQQRQQQQQQRQQLQAYEQAVQQQQQQQQSSRHAYPPAPHRPQLSQLVLPSGRGALSSHESLVAPSSAFGGPSGIVGADAGSSRTAVAGGISRSSDAVVTPRRQGPLGGGSGIPPGTSAATAFMQAGQAGRRTTAADTTAGAAPLLSESQVWLEAQQQAAAAAAASGLPPGATLPAGRPPHGAPFSFDLLPADDRWDTEPISPATLNELSVLLFTGDEPTAGRQAQQVRLTHEPQLAGQHPPSRLSHQLSRPPQQQSYSVPSYQDPPIGASIGGGGRWVAADGNSGGSSWGRASQHQQQQQQQQQHPLLLSQPGSRSWSPRLDTSQTLAGAGSGSSGGQAVQPHQHYAPRLAVSSVTRRTPFDISGIPPEASPFADVRWPELPPLPVNLPDPLTARRSDPGPLQPDPIDRQEDRMQCSFIQPATSFIQPAASPEQQRQMQISFIQAGQSDPQQQQQQAIQQQQPQQQAIQQQQQQYASAWPPGPSVAADVQHAVLQQQQHVLQQQQQQQYSHPVHEAAVYMQQRCTEYALEEMADSSGLPSYAPALRRASESGFGVSPTAAAAGAAGVPSPVPLLSAERPSKRLACEPSSPSIPPQFPQPRRPSVDTGNQDVEAMGMSFGDIGGTGGGMGGGATAFWGRSHSENTTLVFGGRTGGTMGDAGMGGGVGTFATAVPEWGRSHSDSVARGPFAASHQLSFHEGHPALLQQQRSFGGGSSGSASPAPYGTALPAAGGSGVWLPVGSTSLHARRGPSLQTPRQQQQQQQEFPLPLSSPHFAVERSAQSASVSGMSSHFPEAHDLMRRPLSGVLGRPTGSAGQPMAERGDGSGGGFGGLEGGSGDGMY